MQSALADVTSDKERILSHAILRSMTLLNVKQKECASILGVSPSFLSNMANERTFLNEGSKAFECAVMFVRIFRALDALVGGDEQTAKQWIRAENKALNGTPIILMQSIQGLVDTAAYLDQHRAPL